MYLRSDMVGSGMVYLNYVAALDGFCAKDKIAAVNWTKMLLELSLGQILLTLWNLYFLIDSTLMKAQLEGEEVARLSQTVQNILICFRHQPSLHFPMNLF